MFVCPVCQVENRLDAKFCRKCGQSRTALEQYAAATVTERPTNSSAEQSGRSLNAASLNAPGGTTPQNAAPRTDSPDHAVAAEPQGKNGTKAPVGRDESSNSDLSSPECPSCWTVLRATDQYCCWCGEPQPSRALPYMKLCLECSTKLPEKANFCYACGHNVSDKTAQKVRFPLELFREEESEFFPRFDA